MESKIHHSAQSDLNCCEFARAGRSTYLRINLETIWQNIQILKRQCSENTGVIAVVKGNAYWHGSVEVARYLNKRGHFHFAVGTALEGKELRCSGVAGYIQVLGNAVEEEIDTMLEHSLTPTVATLQFIEKWAARTAQSYKTMDAHETCISGVGEGLKPQIVIEVDTGMSRNGCQCDELPRLMKACELYGIPVHSAMTHFAESWGNNTLTQEQLDRFLEATKDYRTAGLKLHAANSAAIIGGYGTDLDFVRPGAAMYGLDPEFSTEFRSLVQSLGLRPALSWIARPSLVKTLEAGRTVGYNQTYKLQQQEVIATFNFGYADGYCKQLTGQSVLTDVNGKAYEIVGEISMDAVTARVDDSVTTETPFYVIKDDFTSPNSTSNIGKIAPIVLGNIMAKSAIRLPRIYVG